MSSCFEIFSDGKCVGPWGKLYFETSTWTLFQGWGSQEEDQKLLLVEKRPSANLPSGWTLVVTSGEGEFVTCLETTSKGCRTLGPPQELAFAFGSESFVWRNDFKKYTCTNEETQAVAAEFKASSFCNANGPIGVLEMPHNAGLAFEGVLLLLATALTLHQAWKDAAELRLQLPPPVKAFKARQRAINAHKLRCSSSGIQQVPVRRNEVLTHLQFAGKQGWRA